MHIFDIVWHSMTFKMLPFWKCFYEVRIEKYYFIQRQTFRLLTSMNQEKFTLTQIRFLEQAMQYGN